MKRSRYQTGSLFVRGKRKKMYVARYYESVIGSGSQLQQVRRSVVLGPVAEIGKRKDTQNRLMEILQPLNLGMQRPKTMMTFREFVEEHWQLGVLPLFKRSTQIGYGPLLRRYFLPQFGSKLLSEITPPGGPQFTCLGTRRAGSYSSPHVGKPARTCRRSAPQYSNPSAGRSRAALVGREDSRQLGIG